MRIHRLAPVVPFVVALAASSFAPRAEACGGGLVTAEGSLVTQESQLALMSLRTPEGDGGVVTTDIAVLLNVPSAEQDFGVLIPLPDSGRPTIDATAIDGAAFASLDRETRPEFEERSEGADVTDSGCGCGSRTVIGDGSIVVSEEVEVGPVTAQYLVADDATVLATYLTDNGFALPEGGTAVVESYITQGNGFLAFKRSTAAASATPVAVGVHFSVPGDLRSVALRMVSFGAPEVLPITLFVAAAEPVGADAPWTTISVEDLDDASAIEDYGAVVDGLTAENDGKLFIFEGAVAQGDLSATALTALIDSDAVVSRLSARIPRVALDADAAFNVDAPAPSAAAAAAAFRMPKNVDAAAIVLVAVTLAVRRRRRRA